MKKTLIIYESKYGCTEEIIKNMALVLGPSNYCKVNEFKDDYKEFDYFVICSPIYRDKIDSKITKFVSDNLYWLQKKKISILCVGIFKSKKDYYLKELKKLLKDSIVYTGMLGGNVNLNLLNKEDYSLIQMFFNENELPFSNLKLYDLEKVLQISQIIKMIIEEENKKVPKELLLKEIEEFLKNHNTCTLATCHEEFVRATPIEYVYEDNHIYFFTEGGEKFCNIQLNPMVSVAVYNNYKNMSKLAGMQISGRASLIDIYSDEYNRVLGLKGMKIDQIKNLYININIIKVQILKLEYINSKFKNKGYEIKQIYKPFEKNISF